MNEVLRQIRERKSMRIFEDREIEEHVREEIINAAFEAPTAGNMMLYSIINVTDKELKEKLAILCDNQPFIEKAPMVLIFVADYQRWYDSFSFAECELRTPGEGDIWLAMADTTIAAQNTVIAAESLGVGSCYIGDIIENYEEIKDILSLPEYVVPACMVVYGYPAEAQRTRKKPIRFEKEYIVFENKYKRLSKDEHLKMHKTKNEKSELMNKDISEQIQAFCKRKYMSEFSAEMNRSMGLYLRKFRKNNKENIDK